ncbi:hypothetical protein FNH09_04055 [Streptomyces adustus]|uniref:PBP domain-containing protein n=1 Tax=Streptomyces adustus TaxID=1609272 RepID=A0A5N8V7B7_9ACTN|nr:hypothetical protein [Streptomyces adustus]MPY30512.1 hypothetical protein [Streptomyces adustus]
MTSAANRPRPRPLLALGALLSALVLALLPVPSATPAAAAADGATDSAVTVTGKKGKYDDFSGLKVTVHQTKDLRSQGVRVSWEGGKPTSEGDFRRDYLQIMQCWGDDAAGPTREQCVFGATGVPVALGTLAQSRSVVAGSGGLASDPEETQYTGANAFVPFRPVGSLPPTTSTKDPTYFGALDTNEQAGARVFAGGSGEVNFEVQDATEAPHLGCGMNTAAAGATPVPRRCWLVVVPRGTHNPDGTDVTRTGEDGTVDGSPLTTTNWAQRMVVPLYFAQVDEFCPAGQAERPTAGSELVTDAVTSWQPKLCSATDSTFAFTQGGEEEARNQVLATTADSPLLGFTVAPVAPQEGAAKVVQAPVAVSGIAVAFFIESPSGVVQKMRLTPRLVAKMLTHSYQKDVSLAQGHAPHLAGNPAFFDEDPEFRKLNPEFPVLQGQPRSLMVPLQSSDTTKLVWNWLQTDAEARDFLAGKADPWGMKVNPYFKDLDLAESTSLTDFPKVDPTVTDALANGTPPLTYTITDLDPYTADLHDGALRTLRGNNNRTIQWQAGDNSPPKLINDAAMWGQRAVLAVVDTASAQRYGLATAALRNADGTFVEPTTATLTAGVAAMRATAADASVLDPDPSRAKGQAYPLTAVAYAAASVDQDAAARTAYAQFIRYAAGPGQTPGLSAGRLPAGYAPLPARQREQAETAADELERGASGSQSPAGTGGSGGVTSAGDTGGSTGATDSGGASGGTAAGAAAAGGTGTTPPASASPSGSTPASSGPQQNIANPAAGITPKEVMGIIRWVLVAVLILGGSAGISGPLMLRLAQRRNP